jgi:hypothetical protein
MNHRIKELAEQAELEMCSCGCGLPTRQSAWFAELIIRECASFIDSHEQVDKYGEALDIVYGEDLMNHFGVKL